MNREISKQHSLYLGLLVLIASCAAQGCIRSTKEVSTAEKPDASEVAPSPESEPQSSEPSDGAPQEQSASQSSDEPLEINFDDLNLQLQKDMVVRPWMLKENVKELDGKRVRIRGFMLAAGGKLRGLEDFILLKNTQCPYGPGGQADHLLRVLMENDTTDYTDKPLEVQGVLRINLEQGADGNTWSVYDVAAEKVRTVRR